MQIDSEFLCKCGHRNKMHITLGEALQNSYMGRICVEYKDAICIRDIWYHNREEICTCGNFKPDNLKTLEHMSESV